MEERTDWGPRVHTQHHKYLVCHLVFQVIPSLLGVIPQFVRLNHDVREYSVGGDQVALVKGAGVADCEWRTFHGFLNRPSDAGVLRC